MASKAPSHPNQGKLIRDYYKLGKTLGTGGFSVVKLGTEKESGTEWAVKIMTLPKPGQKPTEEQNTREEIFYEIDILCHLKHPSVMGLKEYFEEEDKVYLVTELLTGGELLDAVIDCGNYTEEDARQVRPLPPTQAPSASMPLLPSPSPCVPLAFGDPAPAYRLARPSLRTAPLHNHPSASPQHGKNTPFLLVHVI